MFKKCTIYLALTALVMTLLPMGTVQAFKDLRKPEAFVKVIAYDVHPNGFIIPRSLGSGTIIDETGVVLTNNHVVEDIDDPDETKDVFAICQLEEDETIPTCKYVAHLIERYQDMDLALLKIDDTDIYGRTVEEFEYMKYDKSDTPDTGDEIFAVGYPSIGDDSITITKGIVSGLEERNGFTYIKTDTNISPGNSGGAALDKSGDLIGVPTFLRYNYESLGYVLDINEAVSWIDQHKTKTPQVSAIAEDLLRDRQEHVNEIQSTGELNHPNYPNFTLKPDDDWQLDGFKETSYTFTDEDSILNVTIDYFPFSVDEKVIDYTMNMLKENTFGEGDFNKTKTTIQGYEAYEVSGSLGSAKIKSYLIPYGYALVGVMTLQDAETNDEGKLTDVVNTLSFTDGMVAAPPVLETVQYSDPNFSMNRVEPWFMQKNLNALEANLLFGYRRQDRLEAGASVYYYSLPYSSQEKTVDELMQEDLEFYGNSEKKVINATQVTLDGLPGYALTFSYSKNNKKYKSVSVTLLDGKEDYFYILFQDFADNFETTLPEFDSMLATFNYNGPNAVAKGSFDLGGFENEYIDIQNHRFEKEITDLHSKSLMDGFEDQTFRPEQDIMRAHALRDILEARRYMDEKDGVESDYLNIMKYSSEEYAYLDFEDTKTLEWEKPYIRFARDKGIIDGGGTFDPTRSLTIAELLKIAYGVFEIDTWNTENDPTVPWTKPIMDQGYAEGLIPTGIIDPNHIIKRGELAFVLSRLMEIWSNKGYWLF